MGGSKRYILTLPILLIFGQPLRSEDIDLYLTKRYILRNSTNFEAIIKALDLNIWYRFLARIVIPIDSLDKLKDGRYDYSSVAMLYVTSELFKPGVPFDKVTFDKRNITSTITFRDNVMHEVQVEANGRTTEITRTFSEYVLKIVIRVGPAVATRYHELLNDMHTECHIKAENKQKKKEETQEPPRDEIEQTP